MTRTLTITGTEWASAHDGTLWLVREGTWTFPDGMEYADVVQSSIPLPPVEFTLACAPCGTCGNTRTIMRRNPTARGNDNYRFATPCPACRIELVGPCPNVDSWGDPCEGAYEIAQGEWRPCPLCDGENAKPGTVTLGHAYAVGEPKQTEDGKWELLLQVVPG